MSEFVQTALEWAREEWVYAIFIALIFAFLVWGYVFVGQGRSGPGDQWKPGSTRYSAHFRLPLVRPSVQCPKCKRRRALRLTGNTEQRFPNDTWTTYEERLCRYCGHREWKEKSSAGAEIDFGGNGNDD